MFFIESPKTFLYENIQRSNVCTARHLIDGNGHRGPVYGVILTMPHVTIARQRCPPGEIGKLQAAPLFIKLDTAMTGGCDDKF
jgi:hypothetical protein